MSTIQSLEVYGNSFENAEKGIWHTDEMPILKRPETKEEYFAQNVRYDKERAWFVHGNRFTNVKTVCADDIVSFGNIVDGILK